jgi:hypothetical protein
MSPARRIALHNIIAGISADIDNGAEYLTQDPFTHEPLTERRAAAVEREMRRELAKLTKRLSYVKDS